MSRFRTEFQQPNEWVGEVSGDDWLSRPKRPKLIETDMDITPMIDITFLLLIFFLVAARIDDNSLVELPVAKNGLAVTVDDSVVLTVIPEADSVAVFMGENTSEDARIQAADEAQQSEMIADYVAGEFAADVVKQQVLVRASKGIKYQEVARIITAAGAQPGASVYVAVVEEN